MVQANLGDRLREVVLLQEIDHPEGLEVLLEKGLGVPAQEVLVPEVP